MMTIVDLTAQSSMYRPGVDASNNYGGSSFDGLTNKRNLEGRVDVRMSILE